MIPRAKTTNTRSPQIGLRASAAWAEVWMLVTPCACKVAAVEMTMNRATRFEKAMPIMVSMRMRRNSGTACSGALRRGLASALPWTSSTSSSACQKNR